MQEDALQLVHRQGGGPGGPVGGKPRIIQTAAPKADMRIASFHEPDEFDQHWRDQKVACSYVGTFAIDVGKIDKGKILTGMRSMLQYIAQARPATLFFSREGIKVIDTTANKVAMAHALQRISMATGDAQSTLFAFVAKNPKVVDRYCHVFNMPATRTAEDCQALVMKAFRLAFASRKTSQRAKKGQPNAALAAARAAVAGKASAPAPPAMQQHAPDPTRPNKQWAKHNPLQGVHLGRGQAGQAPPSAQPRMSAQIAPKRTSAGGGGGGGGAGGGGGNPQRVPAVGSADDAPGLGSSGWYQPGIPREIAMELLGASAEGSFIVRDSSSQPGQFALTMFAGGLMHHYIIRKVAEGVVLGSEVRVVAAFLFDLKLNSRTVMGCSPTPTLPLLKLFPRMCSAFPFMLTRAINALRRRTSKGPRAKATSGLAIIDYRLLAGKRVFASRP